MRLICHIRPSHVSYPKVLLVLFRGGGGLLCLRFICTHTVLREPAEHGFEFISRLLASKYTQRINKVNFMFHHNTICKMFPLGMSVICIVEQTLQIISGAKTSLHSRAHTSPIYIRPI